MNRVFWNRWGLILILLLIFPLTILLPRFGIINPYIDLVLKYIGINIILTVSLNLVNGYMGEFSVGHAGFMAIGAYVASLLTVWLFPRAAGPFLFPVALLAGGVAAGIAGLGIAFPSFRTRGDYLAIVTLAFNMIIKSVLENLDAIGGPRGFMGMEKLTTLWWVYIWVIITVFLARNYVFSNFGRGVLSIREDEIASGLVSVNTRQVKVLTFVFSAFLAGIAGGLFAHELQFINPRSFTILKSTDMLVMVYLGGIGSLGGSILGATVFTVVMEGLRTVLQQIGISQEWRLVVAPLMLILLMIFRPYGIMGLREFRFLIPRKERPEALNEFRKQIHASKGGKEALT
ncbi:MAG: branched-chain amino acid ABC transporter permease [Anaerolineales bacterium]|nr:branched-chain amino acid ABC transporter permease [Anaerolineales bacterium]NUQ84629.1 branched-chain amino acid ABC transporter permease [Anaerolineales bacterium]